MKSVHCISRVFTDHNWSTAIDSDLKVVRKGATSSLDWRWSESRWRRQINTHQLYQDISVFCVIFRVANNSRASPNFWSSLGNLRSSCGMIVLLTLAILLKTFTASPILPLIISQRTDSGVTLQRKHVTAVAFSLAFSSLRLTTKKTKFEINYDKGWIAAVTFTSQRLEG